MRQKITIFYHLFEIRSSGNGAAFHLSINFESLPIGQKAFAGNQAERDAKSLKSLKW